MTDTGRSKYSTGAMVFHWLIAVLVIVNWRIVEAAEHASEVDEAALLGNHKAIGIAILALTIARLAWRLSHKVPPLPDTMAKWERVLSRTVHAMFYVMLVGLPLGGWLAGSFAGKDISFFGAFAVPALPVGQNLDMAKTIIGFHKTGGEIMIYLIGLHILGALKHTFYDKSGGLARMLPWGKA
ncbi:cytochrome b [Erythrobacter sp. SDW2]|uniref:cytochrome b n=1 Tax=Erythrobacter sp. SDW2 TaxID=2907154 RepID=UPI001F22E57B|nr:cytochrome b [Erythrobacter sp. SDW2]UIP06257.1 cytochrome b [Erythrobacter sp. SDW2]